MSFYTLFYAFLFLLDFFIFFRMSQTNEEEWKYTPKIKGMLIGAIFGAISGALIGTLIFTLTNIIYKYSNWWTGMLFGFSYGLMIGAVAFIINLFLFEYRIKPTPIKPKEKTKEEIKQEQNKLLLKQIEEIKNKIK